MIDRMTTTQYSANEDGKWDTDFATPNLRVIHDEIKSMHPYRKPILFMYQDGMVEDVNLIALCGGSGRYHIQIVELDGWWWEAYLKNGPSREVEVWTSDQGFATEERRTWGLDQTLIVVDYYFEHGSRHPGFSWEKH